MRKEEQPTEAPRSMPRHGAAPTGEVPSFTKRTQSGQVYVAAAFADGKTIEWPGTDVTATPPTSLPAPANFMAHWNATKQGVDLMWDAVPGAASYPVHKSADGDTSTDIDTLPPIATPTTTTYFDPVPQTSKAQMYRYCPAARDAQGNVGPCSPDVSVDIPAGSVTPPTPTGHLRAPANLRVKPLGNKSDRLDWDAVAGGATYNVYLDERPLAKGLTSPNYTVQSPQFVAMRFYSVTAVDSMGMESHGCAPVQSQGVINGLGYDPPEGTPKLVGVGEFNDGKGRVYLSWTQVTYWGNQFRVYRDGQLYADNIGIYEFFDTNVSAGQAHSYQVSAIGGGGKGSYLETGKSNAVSVTPPAQAPASGGTLAVKSLTPNDTSVKVDFVPFPGALDYRVYIEGHPESRKYAGLGSTSVEYNGIDPANIPRLIGEALDKLGPYMPHDGTSNPSDPPISQATRPMPAGMPSDTNGQGNPSNVPNVLATSAPITITLRPKSLAGQQVFLDTFRSPQPLAQSPTVEPHLYAKYQSWNKPNNATNPYLRQYTNDKWRQTLVIADAADTKLFFMGRHFMDTLWDGGAPGGESGDSTPPHNANASTMFEPFVNGQPVAFDFSNGKVLHITMECDPHFTARRWCDIGIIPAGDFVIDPAFQKLNYSARESISQSGTACIWQILSDLLLLDELVGDGTNTGHVKQGGYLNAINTAYPGDHWGSADRGKDGKYKVNGTQADLDNRHVFDFYTDGKRIVVCENGLTLADKQWPQALGFSKAQVYISHHAYHLVNEWSEAARRANEPYYTNYTPMKDERHWTNMGAEVLPSWPVVAAAAHRGVKPEGFVLPKDAVEEKE